MTTAARRRRLTLSVRALMVLVLILGGGIGWDVNRVNARRPPVAVIREKAKAFGAGGVVFDYQDVNGELYPEATSWAPGWLTSILGEEFFHEVLRTYVNFSKLDGQDAGAVMEAVRKLPRLKVVLLIDPPAGASIEGLDRLEDLYLDYTPKGAAGPIHLGTLPSLREISITGPGATDAALAQLPRQPALSRVQIAKSSATDAGLKSLAGIANLRSLDLDSRFVTDAGLKSLGGLAKLQSLEIACPEVAGPGLECLDGMRDLRSLVINCPDVSDDGLAHLAALTRLESLHVRGTRVTDATLEPLGRLTNLEDLGLYGTRGVTDRGASSIARNHRSLQEVWLIDTGITDAGLEHLAGLDALKRLHLGGTEITDAGLAHLRGRLPRLESLKMDRTPITDAGLAHLRWMSVGKVVTAATRTPKP
jgi:hypothetical protein